MKTWERRERIMDRDDRWISPGKSDSWRPEEWAEMGSEIAERLSNGWELMVGLENEIVLRSPEIPFIGEGTYVIASYHQEGFDDI